MRHNPTFVSYLGRKPKRLLCELCLVSSTVYLNTSLLNKQSVRIKLVLGRIRAVARRIQATALNKDIKLTKFRETTTHSLHGSNSK